MMVINLREMDVIMNVKQNIITLVVVILLYVKNPAIMEYLINSLNKSVIMEY